MLKGEKRIIKLLVLVMCTSFISTTIAFAETTGTSSNQLTTSSAANSEADFTFDGSTGTIVKYIGTNPVVVIPSTINGVSVKEIGNYAFFDSYRILKSVIIPDGVIRIGNWAFGGCEQLTSINIPDGVTSLGYSAFSGCKSLPIITIPKSLVSIDQNTFARCSNIFVDNNNTVFKSIDGALYSKDGTKIIQCSIDKTSIVIPEGVTTIGYCAISSDSLRSIYVPDSVTVIEKGGVTGLPNATFYVKSENIKQLLITNGISESKIILNSQTGQTPVTKVTAITIDSTNINLTVGQSETLATTVLPSNATNKGLTWASSNNLVATVDTTGKVTAVGAGSATITCTSSDGSGVTATKIITVSGQTAPNSVLKSVSILGTEEVGHKLKAKIKYDGTEPNVEYKWQRASKKDGDYEDINGADSNDYKLKSSDKNKYIKLIVTSIINGSTYTVDDITSKIDRDTSDDEEDDDSINSNSSDNNSSNNEGVLRINSNISSSSNSNSIANGHFTTPSGRAVTGWLKTSNGTWYYLNQNGDVTTGWVKLSNKWYYLDPNYGAARGTMKTGWILDNGSWYYLYSNGEMASNTTINGYKIGYDGLII